MSTAIAEVTQNPSYASFGEFLKDVILAGRDYDERAERRLQERGHAVKAGIVEERAASGASEAVPSDGGFLLLPQWTQQIVERTYQESAVLRRCTEWTVTNANGLKFPAIDETSRADGSRWGGTRGYWMNEADSITASKPRFRNVELVPKKVGVLTYVTSELLNDMGALAQYVLRVFSKELAFKITDAVMVGDGAGKPQGVLNSPGTITVSKQIGQLGATIVTQNIIDMHSRFWVGSRDGGGDLAWFVHSDAISQLTQLVIAVGTAGAPSFLFNPESMTMLGYPVVAIEQCMALGTVGDILLGDFREYSLAWREHGKLDISMHVKFTNDEQALRLIARVDGQSNWHTPITPQNGSNTQSPFVVLQTR